MAEVQRLPYRAAMAAIIVLALAHASSADAQSAAAPDSLVTAMARSFPAWIMMRAARSGKLNSSPGLYLPNFLPTGVTIMVNSKKEAPLLAPP